MKEGGSGGGGSDSKGREGASGDEKWKETEEEVCTTAMVKKTLTLSVSSGVVLE